MGVVLDGKQGRVRYLTLNRPDRRNALDRETIYSLKEALSVCGSDRETRVIVLTGAGSAFCAGADLRAGPTAPMTPGEELTEDGFNAVIRLIWNMKKPVVAAVNGSAAGYGCSLALACDIRLVSSAAKFSLIFVKRGLTIDGGASYFLPRLTGMRGMAMAMTGDIVDADEAEKMGITDKVFPADSFMEQTSEYADRLSLNAPLALGAIKSSIHAGLGAGLGDVLTDEMAVQRGLLKTEDVREGINAFKEKREPVYRGK